MTKENLIMITERNLKKAEKSYEHNHNRSGVTEQEVENLRSNIEYNKIVLDLINKKMKDNINTYRKAQEIARNKAIEWQLDFNNHNYSYGELAYYKSYFNGLAKRYGLVREFRENGII